MATTGSPDTAWCIACASAAVALCGNATDGLIHKLPPRCWVVAHRANADKSALHGPSANTNVIAFAGRTLALVEGGAACAELSENLETIDVWDCGGALPSGYSGHPITDPLTGDLHAVSYHIGRGKAVRYTVLAADGRLRHRDDRCGSASVRPGWPAAPARPPVTGHPSHAPVPARKTGCPQRFRRSAPLSGAGTIGPVSARSTNAIYPDSAGAPESGAGPWGCPVAATRPPWRCRAPAFGDHDSDRCLQPPRGECHHGLAGGIKPLHIIDGHQHRVAAASRSTTDTKAAALTR